MSSRTKRWNVERRPVFIHVPKTAGSSINSALCHEETGERYHYGWSPGHCPAMLTLHRMGPGSRSKVFVFSFVRNPWDRAVSWFYFHNKANKTFPTKPREQRACFKEFLRKDAAKTLALMNRNPYCMFHDADGGFLLDFVGNYEHLAEDWEWVAKKIGCPNTTLEHINPSEQRRGAGYQSLYDAEGVEMIRGMCWWEIQMWGYKFDTPMPQRYPHFSKPSRRIL